MWEISRNRLGTRAVHPSLFIQTPLFFTLHLLTPQVVCPALFIHPSLLVALLVLYAALFIPKLVVVHIDTRVHVAWHREI
ncbi:hypothetical protein [Rhizobium sp. AC44/96]|uniref:hypothetical protein n=1 Tax=Rhizobium sp. AC44/96 TaxID=1841654 RepID=UPI001147A53A|nr:hypothetical protein [Rhizobium sp. AC44/96]